MAAVHLAAALVGLVGCANQSAPPGGPQDLRPPVVVRTEPEPSGVMTDLGGSVRFHFDERISERTSDGELASAVTVSPLTGEVRVGHGRTSLTVSLDGGFRSGIVYRVTLLPVVSDLFGNRMTEAFEIVFSTGGAPEATATLAGEVWDRLSGQGLSGAMVRAVGADSLVHVARTDQQGVFALRYLPAGDFVVTGFQDLDRDRTVGPRESQGAVSASLAPGDTLVVEIPVLAPDTTPAALGAARALDSTTIMVEFDDYLDPSAPADQIAVRLTRDGGDAPLVTRLFHEHEYGQYVDQVADSFARLDSIDAADRAAAAAAAAPAAPDTSTDSLAAVVDSAVADSPAADAAGTADAVDRGVPARALPPRVPGQAATQAASAGRIRPGRRIVGQLAGPLEPDVEYLLRVTSVVNVNGLPGGGGEAPLVYAPPAAPDTVPAADDEPVDPDAAADPDPDIMP